jgi:hypothetical protein
MRMSLLYILLNIGIRVIFKTCALPIVLRIVAIRNWLYRAFASEGGRAHGEDMLANLPDEIAYYRLKGDSNEEIAAKILFRLVTGLPSDLAIWAPSTLDLFVSKLVGWSDTLRHYRVPKITLAGVAAVVLMNCAYFSSQSALEIHSWLLMNGITIAMTVLIWKREHPLVRRIFNIWLGSGIAASMAMMVWLTINYHFYQTTTFKVFILATAAALPAVIVFEKSWRKRLFGDKWWPIIICGAAIVAGACLGSLLIAHDVKLLLGIWVAMVVFVALLLMVVGAATVGAYILCWLGVRGSAGGLKLLASGIRRLR